MKWKRGIFLSILLLCMPLLMILAMQDEGTLVLEKDETIEEILPYLLVVNIEDEFDMENIKAMAVILRSNLVALMESKRVSLAQIRGNYVYLQKGLYIKRKALYKAVFEACTATEGEVLTAQGKVCYCPYFYASSGMTRDAFDFFGDERFSYLIAAPSYRDEECEMYLSYFYVSLEELTNVIWTYQERDLQDKIVYSGNNTIEKRGFGEDVFCGIGIEEGDILNVLEKAKERETMSDAMVDIGEQESTFGVRKKVEVLESDAAGYVKWVKVADQVIGGELFRYCLGLSSSCFSIEQQNDTIRIMCKGRGHGFGFSQYGANVMAKEGNSYRDLLKHYFPELHIEKDV